jgi:hypothetical protein
MATDMAPRPPPLPSVEMMVAFVARVHANERVAGKRECRTDMFTMCDVYSVHLV